MVLRADSIKQRLLKLEETVSGLEQVMATRRALPDR